MRSKETQVQLFQSSSDLAVNLLWTFVMLCHIIYLFQLIYEFSRDLRSWFDHISLIREFQQEKDLIKKKTMRKDTEFVKDMLSKPDDGMTDDERRIKEQEVAIAKERANARHKASIRLQSIGFPTSEAGPDRAEHGPIARPARILTKISPDSAAAALEKAIAMENAAYRPPPKK